MNYRFIRLLIAIVSFIHIGYLGAIIVPSGSRQSIISSSMITTPGTYFVANDFVGTITIAADNVELDLNYKKISGAGTSISATSHTDIIIKNGILANAFDNHILITSCTNVTIEAIDFIDSKTALFLLNANEINVVNCNYRSVTADVIVATNSFNLNYNTISIFNNSAFKAFQIQACKNLLFNNVILTNNTFTTHADLLAPILLQNTSNVSINNLSIFNDTLSRTSGTFNLRFLLLRLCSNVTVLQGQLKDISFSFDSSTGATAEIIQLEECKNIIINEQEVVNAISTNSLTCYDVITTSSVITIQNCLVQKNSATSTMRGFSVAGSSSNIIFQECIVEGNSGSSALGYSFSATSTVLVDSCIAQKNTASSGSATGFSISSGTASEITIRNCLASSNQGSISSRGFDIGVDSSAVTIFGNVSQDHGTETNNFVISSGSISQIIFTRSTGLFSAAPTPFDNISVQA